MSPFFKELFSSTWVFRDSLIKWICASVGFELVIHLCKGNDRITRRAFRRTQSRGILKQASTMTMKVSTSLIKVFRRPYLQLFFVLETLLGFCFSPCTLLKVEDHERMYQCSPLPPPPRHICTLSPPTQRSYCPISDIVRPALSWSFHRFNTIGASLVNRRYGPWWHSQIIAVFDSLWLQPTASLFLSLPGTIRLSSFLSWNVKKFIFKVSIDFHQQFNLLIITVC